MSEIGSRLKQFRKALKMSQSVLGEIINTDQTSISKYENGEMEISRNAKRELYATFEIDKKWFELGEGEMFINEDARAFNIDVANKYKSITLGLQTGKIASLKARNEESKFRENYPSITLEPNVHAIKISDDYYLNRLPLVSLADIEFCQNYDSSQYLNSLSFRFWKTEYIIGQLIAFINYGSDMYDGNEESIKHNDCLITTPFAKENLTVVEVNRIFVIVHRERILVRKVISWDDDAINFTALNPDKGFYPDLSIKVIDIKKMYLVDCIERVFLSR